jgi:DNA-binding NtrC family response regulator
VADDKEKTSPLLIVEDEDNMRSLLAETFRDRGFVVDTAANGAEAIDLIHNKVYDVIISDLNMPEKGGLDVLKAAKEASPDTQVILVTAYGTIDTAVEAMRLGAYDFIAKPFRLREIELKVDKIVRPKEREQRQAPRTWLHPSVRHMVGDSSHTKHLMRMIEKIGPSRSSVLITGPSGTGKELVAQAIHDASPRHDRPFVALNCAALAPGVLESELFGHEKGAFTGAVSRRIGRFEQAHTGTLFLDEVGEIDPGIQVKLLRVLQEGEFERVGGMEKVKVDVRIVAATNKDLREAIRRGDFREDFYYRLNVFSLIIEPLKHRRDDIPGLIDHFLSKFSIETGKEVQEIDDDVMDIFMRYSWPGNVRELENVMERAVVLTEAGKISADVIPQELLYAPIEPETEGGTSEQDDGASLIEQTDKLESELILGALQRFHWNKTKASEHLGLKRTTLQYKIKKYGLE